MTTFIDILYRFLAVALLALPAAAGAAPPTLTHFYPAGARRGEAVEVTAGGTLPGWPVSAWCDNPGVTFTPAKDKGKFQVTVAAEAAPGPCRVRLHAADGASDLRPFVVGLVPETVEAEPNDHPEKAQPLGAGPVTVNGRLGAANDVDVFALDLRRGQTLVAAVDANRTLLSPADAVLQLLAADGSVLAQNDDHRGLDPQLVFPVPADGRYLVRTFAFPAEPNAGIGFAGGENFVYRLTLTTGGFADHARPLAVERGRPAAVDAVGWNIPTSVKSLPVRPAPDGLGAQAFHPEIANPVAVRLEPHPTAVEQEKADPSAPQRLAPPVTVTGHLASDGEADAYELDARKGSSWNVEIDAAAIDSPLDPVLRLFGPGGNVLKEAQAKKLHTDPSLSVTVPADGRYRLTVADLHGRGGPGFVYALRVAAPAPDFTLKVAADRFTLTPGQPLEVPVTVEARNGLAGKIRLTATDLPPGVTAEPVEIDAKGKAAKLKLTAAKGAASGPFHITGTAASPPGVRPAFGPTPGGPTPHLWLTVMGPGKS